MIGQGVFPGGSAIDPQPIEIKPLFADHSRRWSDFRYVYPVVSRRSRGLSVGVNLNPDGACNFDCIYCQVDRTQPPRTRTVDLKVLAEELDVLVGMGADASLFADPRFASTPEPLQRFNDIAFSGDGEPTTHPRFAEAVRIVADAKQKYGLDQVKIVLITDACYLTKPDVEAGLAIMDANRGEIWAKLDAGTEEYYRRVNRPNYALSHVLENITAAARGRPICIQSLWMRIDGEAPPDEEVDAFSDRLTEIVASGGAIRQVQVYTVARRPAVQTVTALTAGELEALGRRVQAKTGLLVETFPASGS